MLEGFLDWYRLRSTKSILDDLGDSSRRPQYPLMVSLLLTVEYLLNRDPSAKMRPQDEREWEIVRQNLVSVSAETPESPPPACLDGALRHRGDPTPERRVKFSHRRP